MNRLSERLAGLPAGRTLTVGSAAGCGALVNAEGVANEHARFARRDGALTVRDADTPGGTFVNDAEVRGIVPLRHGDRVRMGTFEFTLDLPGDAAPAPPAGPAAQFGSARPAGLSVTLKDATKAVPAGGGKKVILDGVSLHVRPGEFVGVLGASGSGKSTLMKAVAGLSDLTGGTVALDGAATAAAGRAVDRRIAYLPQDVVIHEALPAAEALRYVAELKGVGRSDADRADAVAAVLDRVGVGDRADVPIRRLSGGQRKRVALAAELLGDPQILLLDEATSGLDPATEAEMMRLFRSLADEGRTVVCVTHFPDRLTLCDRLVYLADGKCLFVGPPDGLTNLFGANSLEEVYVRQTAHTPAEWAEAFARTPAGRDAADIPAIGPPEPPAADPPADGQFATLLRRYADLQRADWPNLLLVLGQAPVIGLMIAATFGSIRASYAELHAADTKEVIFTLVLAVLWCGGTAGVREVVKEEAVLRHETRFGVRLPAYLLSKLALLGAVSLAQALMLLVTVRYFTELTGGFWPQLLTLAAAGVTGVALGLLVSAAAGTSERAMTVLPVLLIGQAIFSGGLARLEGVVQWTARLTVPAYWSLDGLRSTLSRSLTEATYPGAPGHYQPPILGGGGPLAGDLLALGVQAAVLMLLAGVVLSVRLSGPRGWGASLAAVRGRLRGLREPRQS